jgi:hypothetical protein
VAPANPLDGEDSAVEDHSVVAENFSAPTLNQDITLAIPILIIKAGCIGLRPPDQSSLDVGATSPR